MKVDKNMAELICIMENIMGSQTYNPKSYNGWTGEQGCSFKYPVNYCENDKALEKQCIKKTNCIIKYIDPECIKTMKYTFGSNHLYIGDGIVKIMEFLEKTYGIDFNELEKHRLEKRKEKMEFLKTELKTAEAVVIKAGCWEVGIDIPEGEYSIHSIRENSYLWFTINDEVGNEINDVFTSVEEKRIVLYSGQKIWLRNDYILGI